MHKASLKPSKKDVDALADLMPEMLAPPFHLLLPDRDSRCADDRVICHTCTVSLPEGSFVKIGPGVFMASPELCYVQLSTSMPFPAYVQLGYELCGEYRLRYGITGRASNARALTSTRALGIFLGKAPRMKGNKNARRAQAFLCDGSKSPMETDIAILLRFPVRMGGYGLSKPLLNRRYDVEKNRRSVLPQAHFALDLYWPAAKIGLEYDSNERHGDTFAIAHDAIRRNGIEHCGIRVVTMTPQQAMDPIEFDRIGQMLSQGTGKRPHSATRDWAGKRMELRDILFARFGNSRTHSIW